MVNVRCVIIDDEPLAVELLKGYIEKLENLRLVADFKNAMDAFSYLKSNKVDLLFLDIEMPGMTGIDFLKSIENAPQVIITTAYREFALEGYELNAVDYLLKPFPFHRFMKAIDKVQILKSSDSTSSIDQDYLFVKSDRKNQKVKFSSILYIESKRDYLEIVMSSGSLKTKEKISDFIDQLPQDRFLRIHRSFLVNIEKITAFTNHDVEIEEVEIPIGATYKNSVISFLTN